jgi:NAD(P)H-dependent FMN reductase
MIASYLFREFDDTQRASSADADQKREQGAVYRYASLPQQDVVLAGAVQQAHQVEQRCRERIGIVCMMHALQSPRPSAMNMCMIHINAPGSKGRPSVLVVMGSIRAGRLCPKIASWVISVAQASTELTYELVDLLDWPLPMNDEPGIPALGVYTQEHTRAWSDKVGGADAIMFVTPQYNWGYPAPLKNAIDHLYKEWVGKPVVIVSYGGHGGGKCAAQLRQVTEGLKMRPVATMPGITLTHDMMGGGPFDPEEDFRVHTEAVRQAVAELVAELETVVT